MSPTEIQLRNVAYRVNATNRILRAVTTFMQGGPGEKKDAVAMLERPIVRYHTYAQDSFGSADTLGIFGGFGATGTVVYLSTNSVTAGLVSATAAAAALGVSADRRELNNQRRAVRTLIAAELSALDPPTSPKQMQGFNLPELRRVDAQISSVSKGARQELIALLDALRTEQPTIAGQSNMAQGIATLAEKAMMAERRPNEGDVTEAGELTLDPGIVMRLVLKRCPAPSSKELESFKAATYGPEPLSL